MQTPEQKTEAVNMCWKAFIAGALIGIASKMDSLDNTMTETFITDEDRKTLRHGAHLLFPTDVTEEEFKDEC